MSDYTSDEINESVEKVVRSSVRRLYGSLGNRDTQTTFNDLQDAAAGVFLLYPNSPFYVVYLGTERLTELVETEQETLTELIDAVNALYRRTTEVDNLAPLANARAALQALELAAASRDRSFGSVEDVPAFKRYDANLQRFLDTSGDNVRYNGEITSTPQEVRETIPALIRTFQQQHEAVVARADYLVAAIDDYDNMRLPSLVSSGVISRARQVLAARIEELEALSPEDRLKKMREVVLDLLSGRAAVREMGSIRQTTLFADIEGTGQVYADTDHPATPAKLEADRPGPYPIHVRNGLPGNNELYTRMEDSFQFTGLLPGSFIANITTTAEEWVIDASNDSMVIEVYQPSGTTSYTIPIINDVTKTSLELAADLSPVLAPSPLEAVPVVKIPRYIGTVDFNAIGFPFIELTLPASAGNWEDYGITSGDLVLVTVHSDALEIDNWYRVTGAITGNQLQATYYDGGGGYTGSDDAAAEVEVGAGRAARIQFKEAERRDALLGRSGFGFPYHATDQTALATLGFTERTEIYSRSTEAQTIAEELTNSYNTQQAGVPRLLAEATFVSLRTALGRTNPDSTTTLVAYKFRGEGTSSAGVSATFLVDGAYTAGARIDDIVVIRETTIDADMNVKGVITAVDDTQIVATMDQAVSVADVLVEVGEDFDLLALLVTDGKANSKEYLSLRVTDSLTQNNIYTMTRNGQGSIPFEFTVEQAIPDRRAQGGLPQFFTIELGLERVDFSSTDTTLDTKAQVFDAPFAAVPDNSAHAEFFDGVSPFEAVGTTKYFQIPEDPRNLAEDDRLQIFATDYSVPDLDLAITTLELSQLLIHVLPELPTDYGTVDMSTVSPIPFAKVRLQQKNNYGELEEALTTWLALAENQDAWFTELYRIMNPLLVDKNPSLADVSTARAYLSSMTTVLENLVTLLGAYDVSQVDAIDTMITTYQERGSNRGIDVLLQGRFSDFFALTPESMTYAGQMRETIREVSREDMPVRKIGRHGRIDTESIEASFEDPNYEFDLSDVEGLDDIDIPGDYEDLVTIGR
jgi:hypothetical protein